MDAEFKKAREEKLQVLQEKALKKKQKRLKRKKSNIKENAWKKDSLNK